MLEVYWFIYWKMDIEAIESSVSEDSVTCISDMDYDPNEQLVDEPSLLAMAADITCDQGQIEMTMIYFVWVGIYICVCIYMYIYI